MKKTLIALAALAATGASFAQVTIYGRVDAGYNYLSQDGVTKSGMGNSQLASSKLGFMGTEDLGSGLSGIFKLEGGLANPSGNGKTSNTNNQATGGATSATGGAVSTNGSQGLDFQRFSYVGLKGNFGELHLGREYHNTFLGVQAANDVFGTNGPADSTNLALKLGAATAVVTNVSNAISYYTPSMGGFNASLQYWMGQNNSNVASAVGSNSGNGYSVTLGYAAGPLMVALGSMTTNYAQSATAGDYNLNAFTAGYNFGAAKVEYTWTHEGINSVSSQKNDTNRLGLIVPVGATNFKASWAQAQRSNSATWATGGADEKATQWGLGADYNLSKRTTLFFTYANVKNDGGASYTSGSGIGAIGSTTVGNSTDNYAIGISHAF